MLVSPLSSPTLLMPPAPIQSSTRSRTTSFGEGDALPVDPEQALVALAAGAGFLSPVIEMTPPPSRSASISSASSSSSSGSTCSPFAASCTRRPTLRSVAGRLRLDVKPISARPCEPVEISFKLGDRTCIPRQLLSRFGIATCAPASAMPEPLRQSFTALFVQDSAMDVFIQDPPSPDAPPGLRRAARLLKEDEGVISLADFCFASGGIARLQRDGEFIIEFRS